MNEEKNIDEEFIETIVKSISATNMTYEEKRNYTKKILKYIRLKIDYYRIMGIDVSLATLIVGIGLGTTVSENDSPYLPVVFGGLGVASLLTTSIKRKIKYKDVVNNFMKKEIKTFEKKI